MVIQRFAAFTHNPNAGNPAGIVIGDEFPSDAQMQAVAADVGYSETVFAVIELDGSVRVRYFSPRAEVAFCGHATIALAVAMSQGLAGSWTLHTEVGDVPISVMVTPDGEVRATLTSAVARTTTIDAGVEGELLAALRLERGDLDGQFPVAVGDSGNRHPVVVLQHRHSLTALTPDLDALLALCNQHSWTTVAVVHHDGDRQWSSRNLFPVGGVAEDPATGSAAIAMGAVLRTHVDWVPPMGFEIEQGRDMGRPSHLFVSVPTIDGPISVTGTAAEIEAGDAHSA
jgi:PhzF family phenazine biosynthesis protein